jgi:hypothetical protein
VNANTVGGAVEGHGRLRTEAWGQAPSMTDRDKEPGPSPEAANPAAPDTARYAGDKGTWLSPDEDDPQRDEAAERARKAVEPGRPRE